MNMSEVKRWKDRSAVSKFKDDVEEYMMYCETNEHHDYRTNSWARPTIVGMEKR
jgi:hypothetical protein